MTRENRRWVLVTGASTGIGRATAEFLAGHGFGVYAGARKMEDLAALGSVPQVVPVQLDVQRAADVQAALDRITAAGTGLFGIVNNAGIARAGPLMDVPVEDLIEQFDVNLFGVHRVTRAFLPLVVAGRGRVVMISSDSGFFAAPFFGPYCSSKFALEGYADALRREMSLLGVTVVIVEPGRVVTPIWNKGEALLGRAFTSSLAPLAMKVGRHALESGKTKGLSPASVGRVIHQILVAKRPKARYLVAREKMSYGLLRFLPAGMVDALVAKKLKRLDREGE